MYVHNEQSNSGKFEVIEFDSLSEYYKYICETPINESFRWARHGSVEGTERFTGTKSFDEAVDLFKNGWTSMAQLMTQKMNLDKNIIQNTTKSKMIYDVQGFQCSVPRYLQGLPDSMINKKSFPSKQKVLTLNKNICYSSDTRKETIIEESIKALQIVKKLEAEGYRINLNLVCGQMEDSYGYGMNFAVKIRIKNANERLNVSKLAFPLVNPSMLRRLQFRFTEVHPTVAKSFISGYGAVAHDDVIKSIIGKEYLLPMFFSKNLEDIHSAEDL